MPSIINNSNKAGSNLARRDNSINRNLVKQRADRVDTNRVTNYSSLVRNNLSNRS